MPTRRAITAAALATLVAPLVAACVPNDTAAGASSGVPTGALTVRSTAAGCDVSADSAPSGQLTFRITNDGSDVTEFYLLADDGLRIVSEIENIGPGLSRDMVVQVGPGSYFTACKPGMVGDGIRAAFTVSDSGQDAGPTGDTGAQLAAAEASYVAYVKDQVGALIAGTQKFAAAYAAGNDQSARELYAPTRLHWERVEPVAESFGDLDPLLDLREADLEDGQEWTGWHLVEKDLWQPEPAANGGQTYTPLTPEQRRAAADAIVANTQKLYDQVNDPDFTFEAFQIANGAKALLDEVASGKVTGEEEIWSHTDLWDFQGNLDGAKVAYEVLADVVTAQNPDLSAQLSAQFDRLNALLAGQGSVETRFTRYDELSNGQVRELADAVNALSEPLSQLTATITGA